jgi:hypothetical protein
VAEAGGLVNQQVPLQGQKVNLRANLNGYLDAVSLRYELSSLARENHEMQGGLVHQSRSAIDMQDGGLLGP